MARPPSLSEHIRRYARKHRASASAAITILILLVTSVIAIMYFAVEASTQRDIATREAIAARDAEAEAISEAERANRNFDRLQYSETSSETCSRRCATSRAAWKPECS